MSYHHVVFFRHCRWILRAGDEKRSKRESFFVARQLGRAYDVSGRSGMMSFMGGGAVLVCWYFSHGYEWSLCIVFGVMKWWMVAVSVEICDHGASFVRVETDDFAERERERVEKKDVVEPGYKLMNRFLIITLSPQKKLPTCGIFSSCQPPPLRSSTESRPSTLTNDSPWSHISTPTATIHYFMAPKTIQRDHSYPWLKYQHTSIAPPPIKDIIPDRPLTSYARPSCHATKKSLSFRPFFISSTQYSSTMTEKNNMVIAHGTTRLVVPLKRDIHRNWRPLVVVFVVRWSSAHD